MGLSSYTMSQSPQRGLRRTQGDAFMNVKNCRKCGRLFNYALGPMICPQCRDALEEKFKEVKKYIQDHPMCGIQEVSRECDVEVSQIQQWLREERLEFTSDSVMVLNCESCGSPIRCGKFCDNCKNQLTNSLKSVMPQKAKPVEQPKKDPREAARMRFLG